MQYETKKHDNFLLSVEEPFPSANEEAHHLVTAVCINSLSEVLSREEQRAASRRSQHASLEQ